MKAFKKRIVSMLLVLVTLLAILPTSAFAATSTGTGITPTTNPDRWTTRLTSTGQPYSYRPPTAAGKQLYCMDLGYSYRYGTASFLNSYTYTSATGADADALWEKAVAKTGLGEMDAITKENVKWMMSYIADYTGEIPGSLRGQEWRAANALSLSGIYQPRKDGSIRFPAALEQYLKDNPGVERIVLCLDNDRPGRAASAAIQKCLPQYEVIDNPPRRGKDYNDQLRLLVGGCGRVRTRGGEAR